MMIVVVKKVGKKIVDETKFENRKDAEDFAKFANATVRLGVRYEVTERE